MQEKCAAAALACVIILLTNPAPAQENFAGKTVTLTVGYAPGSGNDIYSRLVARHLGKHIPGKPTVVTQNMPGAGSYKAANYMFAAAPRDGSMLGYISQTAATEELLGHSAVQFKTAQFNWVGRIGSYSNITIFWHTSKIKTIADVLKSEATIGATGVGSAVYIYPNMMNKVLGTKFKIVSGYQGTAQSSLAMERGEVEGVTMGWFPVKTTKPEWVREKKITFLVQFLTEPASRPVARADYRRAGAHARGEAAVCAVRERRGGRQGRVPAARRAGCDGGRHAQSVRHDAEGPGLHCRR